jgi:hypothetical protein
MGTYHVEVSVGHCSHLTRYSNILEVPSGLLPTALRLHISIIPKFTLSIGNVVRCDSLDG